LKKFLIVTALIVFLLLTALYLTLNSPYVIDKIAQKFLPEYHLRYDKISGNPLKGIVIDDLYYKGKRLAKEIRIRINPYTLLQRTVTLSRLEALDVNVPVLEGLIKDFSPTSTPKSSEEPQSGALSLPVNIALQNIRLSLLPFERYGIRVKKEELSIDSIYYDGKRFNVGTLKQIADTSIGKMEFEGTYHRRFLDVKYLIVDELDLGRLSQFFKSVGGEGQESTQAQSPEKKEGNVSGVTASEDPFLPRRIRAKKLRISLRPFALMRGFRLGHSRLEGHGLDLDLEHRRLLGGALRAQLQSDLGRARVKIRARKDRLIVEEGIVRDFDPGKILELMGSSKDKGKISSPRAKPHGTAATTESLALDHFPFVPRYVEFRHLRLEVEPEEIQGVPIHAAAVKIEEAELDLHRRKALAKVLEASLDTPLLHADLRASIGSKALRVSTLSLTDLDLDRILAWQKEWQRSVASPGQSGEAKGEGKEEKKLEKKGAASQNGVSIPFLPTALVLDRASIEAKPTRLGTLQSEEAKLELTGLQVDLAKLIARKGRLSARIDTNLAKLRLSGKIRDNRLLLRPPSQNHILLAKTLFQAYKLPLRAEAFSPILLVGEADHHAVTLQASFHAEKILADSNGSFNLDVNHSVTTFRFDLAKGSFKLQNDSLLLSPLSALTLHAVLEPDRQGVLAYRGFLKSPGLKLSDPKIATILGKPRIDFEGDLHSVMAKLNAGVLQGAFRSGDFKKGLLTLSSKGSIELAHYLKLPKKLQKAALAFETRTPIDFAKPLPLDTRITVRSNLANLDGDLLYDGKVSLEAVAHFPKNSLLKALLPKLNFQAIDPLKIALNQREGTWVLSLLSKGIKANVDYVPTSEKLKGVIDVAGSKIVIQGKPKERIVATLKSPSVKTLIKKFNEIYRMETPKLDGDLALKLQIDKLSQATLELRSKQFVPDDTARIKNPIKNIDLLLGADLKKKALIVKKYSLETGGMKIFATKESWVKLDKDRVIMEAFWVNDSLKMTGEYDLKKKRGSFVAKAPRFKVIHENADLEAAIDLKAKIVGDKIDAKGTVTILGGKVMYDLEAKHYATDEDIIILQHQKKDEGSFFRKNVQITLFIKTKKPLIFKQKDVYVEISPQLSVIKPFDGDLQLLGSVKLAKNGYYIFEGKKFILEESSIIFTGKPTLPLLDIRLVYRRYSKTIYIRVNGLATEPNINFSSDPFMTRSQILSFILFDTEETGENAEDMMSMVGGGIAKSILGNIGLKVDTLIVTSSGFEVGKKITDRITILYDQRAKEPKIIVRIKHSQHTQTDISIGSKSQSVDIIYKKEY
jgi:translocation and assembly module TamB